MNPATLRKIDNARTNLKIAVALSGMPMSEISQKAGLSLNVVSKFLRKESMISFANMQAVCDVMGVPMALITSERQITPARIRLVQAMERMNDAQLAEFVKREIADQ